MNLSLDQLVSSDTIQKIKMYETLLREWNRRTSLVQEDTLAEFISRHVIDSLQLIPIIQTITSLEGTSSQEFEPHVLNRLTIFEQPIERTEKDNSLLDDTSNANNHLSIIDVGSGAGFPGMVLAICGFQKVTLCDSNQKKCLFLSEVARQTGTKVSIINDRVENLHNKYDLILSRACTDLNGLCSILDSLASSNKAYGLFHKGRNWQAELETAYNSWRFYASVYRSMTSLDGVVILVRQLESINT